MLLIVEWLCEVYFNVCLHTTYGMYVGETGPDFKNVDLVDFVVEELEIDGVSYCETSVVSEFDFEKGSGVGHLYELGLVRLYFNILSFGHLALQTHPHLLSRLQKKVVKQPQRQHALTLLSSKLQHSHVAPLIQHHVTYLEYHRVFHVLLTQYVKRTHRQQYY